MDDSGHARIADFGLATITKNLDSMPSASCPHGHTPQCTAPEVLLEGTCSKEGDIFSFAMVMIEVRHGGSSVRTSTTLAYYRFILSQVFTGAIPFSGKPPFAAMSDIMQGRRPPRPTYPTFTESLWGLMQSCWDPDPHLRPEASGILQVLLVLSASRLFQ